MVENKKLGNCVDKLEIKTFDIKEYYKKHYDVKSYENALRMFRTRE